MLSTWVELQMINDHGIAADHIEFNSMECVNYDGIILM